MSVNDEKMYLVLIKTGQNSRCKKRLKFEGLFDMLNSNEPQIIETEFENV